MSQRNNNNTDNIKMFCLTILYNIYSLNFQIHYFMEYETIPLLKFLNNFKTFNIGYLVVLGNSNKQ